MPAGRRTENNAMLYALVAFVALFIVATVLTIIFYVKYQDQMNIAQQTQRELADFINKKDMQQAMKIVGPKTTRETYFGNMVAYFDRMARFAVGLPAEGLTAKDLTDNAQSNVEQAVEDLAELKLTMPAFDPNTSGLVSVVKDLHSAMKQAQDTLARQQQEIAELKDNLKKARSDAIEMEQMLQERIIGYVQEITKIKSDYNDLQVLLRKTGGEQLQMLNDQLKQEKQRYEKTYNDLLQAKAQLDTTMAKLEKTQKQLLKYIGSPNPEAVAYKPDGKVILVDNQIVHLNIGRDDHVYPGLTFGVYQRSAPIPSNGKGKAEIQVYDVQKNVSAARVIVAEPGQPIVVDDIVANLVWDSNYTNTFVIAGDFDLDGDGTADYNADIKLAELIKKWGGAAADDVTIDTDFVILGTVPRLPTQPTTEELGANPLAAERYQKALKKLNHYNEVTKQAQALWVPIFNQQRFLYFIGYKVLSTSSAGF